MKTYSQQESDKIEKLIKKLKTLITRFTKTKKLWSELAEYCYDEDVYKDYKGARINMRTAISSIEDTEDLMGKLKTIKASYDNDVKFMNDAEKASK